MTTPTPESVKALADLADRVESATGPDRELDAAVHKAVFGIVCCLPLLAPAYTASLDAAMTLVPENPYNTGERFQVESWTTNGVHAEHVRASAWVSGTRRVFAATPALSLIAASLRARAHIGASHE